MMELVSEALVFAAKAHDTMRRRSGNAPYILHPMEAAAIAASLTDDPQVLAAAVLHDVMEDCGVSESELRVRFGKRVAQMVRLVSEESVEDCGGSWQKRKLYTLNKLTAASKEQMILTLADKLSNLRSMERELEERGKEMWAQQPNRSLCRWYYGSVGELLSPLKGTPAYREYEELVGKVLTDAPERP
jgi:myo-inositol-1(or 4)-monophosphatase